VRYREPNLRTMLAGEYVLGTLQGRARRRFEQLLEGDPVLRGEVENWQLMLSPLADALPERQPPERVWQQLRQRIGAAADAPGSTIRPTIWSTIWGNLRFWRVGGLLAAACAVLMAVLLVVQLSREPEIRYVAVVADSQQRSAWLVTATPRLATLEVRTLQAQVLANDRSFELWLLPGGGGSPRSLGLLGSAARSARRLPRTTMEALPAGTGLAVSLEPKGGSPTGQPTGPVLYQGRLLRL
jgi:anti-sigma-K factor RskA